MTLNTGGGAKFSLDATTGSGTIHSDPPISVHGSLERHHITGDINGGGVTVRVETGSGDIRIHERDRDMKGPASAGPFTCSWMNHSGFFSSSGFVSSGFFFSSAFG